MPVHGDYTVTIRVGGRALQEYDPDENHGHTASQIKYIEVAAGAEFSIQAHADRRTAFPTKIKGFRFDMDGVAMGWLAIRATEKRYGSRTTGWRAERGGHHFFVNGKWMKQNFQFSNLLTTEDKGDFELLQKMARSAGTIKVEVYNVTVKEAPVTAVPRSAPQTVPEKALKGRPIDLAAGLGQIVPSRPISRSSSVMPVGDCLASFVFMYRSRRSLQMLDIIPATPEPETLQEQNPNSSSLADARNPILQYQAKEQSIAVIKQERPELKSENDHDQKAPHKRSYIDPDDDECQIISVKKAKTSCNDGIRAEVEVLDLT